VEISPTVCIERRKDFFRYTAATMSIEQIIQSIDEQISRLQQAKMFLNGSGSGKATGKGRGPRTLSAAARRKIAAAQRARWARVKAAKKK
jgi:hypothetical protein